MSDGILVLEAQELAPDPLRRLSSLFHSVSPSDEGGRPSPELVKEIDAFCCEVAAIITETRFGSSLNNMIIANGRPFLLRGLPTDSQKPALADALLQSLVTAFGFAPFGYFEQNGPSVTQTLSPLPGWEQTVSSLGRTPLEWHADDAIFGRSYRAEGIALLCLNNESETATKYARVDDVTDAVGAHNIALLQEAEYFHISPKSFKFPDGSRRIARHRPVVTTSPTGALEIGFAMRDTQALNPRSRHADALDALHAAGNRSPHLSMALRPGELFLFSNTRGMHARGQVSGRRVMKRAYFRGSLQELFASGTQNMPGPVFMAEPLMRSDPNVSLLKSE